MRKIALTVSCLALAASAAHAEPVGPQPPYPEGLSVETTTVQSAADDRSDGQVEIVPPNPQIDYDGFVELAIELAEVREKHRLPLEQFLAKSREEGAILLDTRSTAAFAEGHLKGAINLPFSDFTSESLAEAIGEDTTRPIYIYCNNNFLDDVRPVLAKKATLALNIPTFINLHGYGYTNVWEMAGVVGTADTSWVSAEPSPVEDGMSEGRAEAEPGNDDVELAAVAS